MVFYFHLKNGYLKKISHLLIKNNEDGRDSKLLLFKTNFVACLPKMILYHDSFVRSKNIFLSFDNAGI